MSNAKIQKMKFSVIYPLLVNKAVSKGRLAQEVDVIIRWLTGYDEEGLKAQVSKEVSMQAFFDEAPQMNPLAEKITGVICGHRVEEIADPFMRKVRQLDKMVDELAKGKPMEKILRG